VAAEAAAAVDESDELYRQSGIARKALVSEATYSNAIDKAVAALENYVEAREHLAELKAAYEAARRKARAEEMPVAAPDSFALRYAETSERGTEMRRLKARADCCRGSW
jgi:hypothetical protein